MFKFLKNYSKRPKKKENNKINVLVFIRKNSVPSDLRFLSIFNIISQDNKYNFYIASKNDYPMVKKDIQNNSLFFDYIIFQRDYIDFNIAKSLILKSTLFKYKIIYEIDDDLVNMDKSNPGYSYYSSIRKKIEFMIKSADIVTVTTKNLKEQLCYLNKEIIVIPNRLIDSWFDKNIKNRKNGNIIKIGYMGSIYHSWDLILVEKAIEIVKKYFSEKNIEIIFELIGGTDNSLNWANQIEVPKESVNYFEFVNWFKNFVNWDIAIAPLEESNLNYSKSELKYLEYSALEIPGVYSNVGPYKENIIDGFNGLLVFNNDPTDWANTIIRLIENENLKKEIIFNSQNDVKNNYLIKFSVLQWKNIFEDNYKLCNDKDIMIMKIKLKFYSLINKFKNISFKSLMNFMLNKSNSYKFYKNEYNSSLKQIKKLKNELNNDKQLIDLLDKRLEINSDIFIKFNKEIHDINIAYVLSGFPNLSETFIVNEIRWLVENNYNVIIFTKNKPYKSVQIDFNVDIIFFDNELELGKLLLDYEIDFIHTHFVYPIGSKFTFPISEQLKIPFTIFTHAFDIFIKKNRENNNICEISKSKYCLGIFTLSNFHKNFLLEENVDENKIIVTRQASNYEICEIKNKRKEIINIVSISRFVEKKGIDTLIEAAKLLENEKYIFTIYGFGPLENELKNKIKKLNCKNISIKGELPPDQVQNILLHSDLLVCPYKIAKNGDMDGFPTIIFEAMATGTPFIATNISAIPEFVKDNENGFLIEADNPVLLANKITEIKNMSSEKLVNIVTKAQNDVINISSVEKTMSIFINTLEKNKL